MSFPAITLTPSTQALLILAIGIAAIHYGGTTLSARVLARSEYQVLRRDPSVPSSSQKMDKINVIQEASSSSPTAAPTHEVLSTVPNAVFADSKDAAQHTKDKKGNKSQTEPEADYFVLLTTGGHLHLDAVTHNGAIINGRFIPNGGLLDSYAYPAPGADAAHPEKLVTPRLLAISTTTATITEPIPPHRKATLRID